MGICTAAPNRNPLETPETSPDQNIGLRFECARTAAVKPQRPAGPGLRLGPVRFPVPFASAGARPENIISFRISIPITAENRSIAAFRLAGIRVPARGSLQPEPLTERREDLDSDRSNVMGSFFLSGLSIMLPVQCLWYHGPCAFLTYYGSEARQPGRLGLGATH